MQTRQKKERKKGITF